MCNWYIPSRCVGSFTCCISANWDRRLYLRSKECCGLFRPKNSKGFYRVQTYDLGYQTYGSWHSNVSGFSRTFKKLQILFHATPQTQKWISLWNSRAVFPNLFDVAVHLTSLFISHGTFDLALHISRYSWPRSSYPTVPMTSLFISHGTPWGKHLFF
jgi:hypothetical protein